MSILITILAVIGSLIALFLIIAFFTPREFSVEKQITISKAKQEVFNYLKLLKNQEYYSIWVMKDPNIKLVYTGNDGTVGATSAWTSDDKNVGVGEQEIKKITDGESMEVEIRFKKPFQATNNAVTTVSSAGNGQTTVSNLFYGKSKFPMNFSNLFMGKLVGKDMQKNLENLKVILEK
ncbi:hypothetical protein CAP36_10685 [Chitinophagaceae bacterium IBVUCB2]|nr:hypothetical protein CAP36_10685 [Chitinophagaceae bacterium IBVUCB2]